MLTKLMRVSSTLNPGWNISDEERSLRQKGQLAVVEFDECASAVLNGFYIEDLNSACKLI
ncbi:MAG TPA: hypothetical protein VGU45_17495 [Microvirga sp.]|nr:hypothetical protein [Microvirga sp.]